MLLVGAVKKIFEIEISDFGSKPNFRWFRCLFETSSVETSAFDVFSPFSTNKPAIFPDLEQLVGRILLGWNSSPPERNPSETLVPRRSCRFGQEEHWGRGPWHFCGIWRVPDFQWHVPAENQSLFLRLWTPREATTKTVTLRSSEVSDIWKWSTA